MNGVIFTLFFFMFKFIISIESVLKLLVLVDISFFQQPTPPKIAFLPAESGFGWVEGRLTVCPHCSMYVICVSYLLGVKSQVKNAF